MLQENTQVFTSKRDDVYDKNELETLSHHCKTNTIIIIFKLGI